MSAVGLPPHILALFQARPPLEFIKPPKRKRMAPYTGIAEYVDLFETTEPPPIIPYETPKAKKERLKYEKIVEHELKLRHLVSTYDAHANSKNFGDPFKTLFVARINYDTTEKKLKREFEEYGSIRKIRMVCDKNNKPRGYAFIEFESDRYMKEAYKQADGRKIDGRRVLVDVERGRTIAGWLPRRFGGGRGPARGNVGKSRASMLADIVNSLKSNVFCKFNAKESNNILDELISGGAVVRDKPKAIKHEEKDKDRKERKERDKERSDRKKDKRPKSKDRERKRSRSRDKDRRRDRSRSKDKERDRERRRDRDER